MSTRAARQKVALAGIAGIAAFSAGALLRTNSASAPAGDDVVAPLVRGAGPSARTADAPPANASATVSRLEAEVAFNPFGPLNAGVPATLGQPKVEAAAPKKAKPASASAPPAPAPPPVAPTLPFVAIGLISGADVTGGPPVAFLQQQDRLLIVRAGETVAGAWRLESITPQRIEFTYLPLMQRQSLPLAP